MFKIYSWARAEPSYFMDSELNSKRRCSEEKANKLHHLKDLHILLSLHVPTKGP